MKLKLTSRSFIYIALLSILIIVFYYGVKFIGTSTEGLGVMTNKRCSGIRDNNKCSIFCKKRRDSNGVKFDSGTCCERKCRCGTNTC